MPSIWDRVRHAGLLALTLVVPASAAGPAASAAGPAAHAARPAVVEPARKRHKDNQGASHRHRCDDAIMKLDEELKRKQPRDVGCQTDNIVHVVSVQTDNSAHYKCPACEDINSGPRAPRVPGGCPYCLDEDATQSGDNTEAGQMSRNINRAVAMLVNTASAVFN